MHIESGNRQHLVAVENLAGIVDEDGAIGVAVQRDREIGALMQQAVHAPFRDKARRSAG